MQNYIIVNYQNDYFSFMIRIHNFFSRSASFFLLLFDGNVFIHQTKEMFAYFPTYDYAFIFKTRRIV